MKFVRIISIFLVGIRFRPIIIIAFISVFLSATATAWFISFDVVTGAELTNSSITENGFYLDLAKSRYLNIDIKKEACKEGAEGLTEDVRFNKPAKDGEQYTDEGIYTITVSNVYTNQTTTKVIYVGTDDVLKAHVTTGLSIADVEYQLSVLRLLLDMN